MTINKVIKVLCCIVMGCIFLVSISLIIFGLDNLIKGNWFSAIWIALGLLIPLITCISLYPVFALTNIDENLMLLNEKIDLIALSALRISENIETSTKTVSKEDTNNFTKDTTISEALSKKTIQDDKLQDAIDFINQKYDINIEFSDNLETLKSKISQIGNKSSSANVLIQKVLNADNIETIMSAFILHKAVCI